MPEARLKDDLVRVLFDEEAIRARLDELGDAITRDYVGKELTVVAVLHGGLVFLADLLRRIDLPVRVATVSAASYHGGTRSCGEVTFAAGGIPDLAGQDVLVLDDILDTGRTLRAVSERLADECRPQSLRTCVLLSKRRPREAAVEADYTGFEIGDEFVVGYGLDFQGRYRNLPLIGVLDPAITSGAGGEGAAP
jgi:hypoxanthine phosphoribosyltransferase